MKMHSEGGGVPARPNRSGEELPLAATVHVYGGRWWWSGPRLVAACFVALSAGVTVALLAQVRAGDSGQLVPHGSVSSSAAPCSRAGTDLLLEGGRALDAAAATALCLAVLAPHRTSLDASGSLLYWEYRQARSQPAQLAEWGGVADSEAPGRPPRLVAALAALHTRLGAVSWSRVLEPAVRLARSGYEVSEGLAAALRARSESAEPREVRTAPLLAGYLANLQQNTSAELAKAWGTMVPVRLASVAAAEAGRWRVRAGGPGAGMVARALATSLQPAPTDALVASARAAAALQAEGAVPTKSVASGIAVVDRLDTYVALVTGVSQPFGSGNETVGGWVRDEPAAPLDLAPAILTDGQLCGTRFVVGAESAAALAQAASALATEGVPVAVESARSSPTLGVAPWAAVNVVRQQGDALSSHADSRGGGLSSRF